jgi:hypothetical protein
MPLAYLSTPNGAKIVFAFTVQTRPPVSAWRQKMTKLAI